MIYLAAPYSHPNKEIVLQRVETVCKYSAKLLIERKQCISPITVGTSVLLYAELPTDFEFWQHFSYDLLKLCDTLYVLKLDGWVESTGVQAEIKFANENNIPVIYIEKETLEELLKSIK